MEERYWVIIADGTCFEYFHWEDILEDFLLFSQDENYTKIEVFDPIINATLLESEEGEIKDILGLLE